MNRDEAKQVLLLYRPGTADAEDPEIVSAMELARQDPELGNWFNNHVQFQQGMMAKMRGLEAPNHLKAELLAGFRKVVRPPWWTRPAPVWITAAAACVLLLGLITFPPHREYPNQFSAFKERVVGEVQRQYAMDWETSDMSRLRESIAAHGGRADYSVPKGLANLKLSGGAVLKWQRKPVSMVCFDRGGGKMLFLFVLEKDAVKDPPPTTGPQLAVVHDLMTASWTQGGNAYVLAGPEEQNLQAFAKKYLD